MLTQCLVKPCLSSRRMRMGIQRFNVARCQTQDSVKETQSTTTPETQASSPLTDEERAARAAALEEKLLMEKARRFENKLNQESSFVYNSAGADQPDNRRALLIRAQELEELNSPTSDRTMTFRRAFSFGGPAPEVINGRAAMIGFFIAMWVELLAGDNIYTQLEGLWRYDLAFVILIAFGSVVPLFRGTRVPPSFTFNFACELVNGRAAMLGFVVMLIIEAITGEPTFSPLFQ